MRRPPRSRIPRIPKTRAATAIKTQRSIRTPRVSPSLQRRQARAFPRHRFIWRNLFAGRLNPLGLINRFEMGWRVQLIDKPGKIYRDSQISVLLHTAVSPAFTHVGGRIEVQPLTVVRLGVTYAFMGSHGIFDFVQPFDDPNAEFDDTTLDDRKDLNMATTGHYLEPGVLLQAALGPVAVRNETKGYYRRVGGVAKGGYFWDPSLDVLYANNRWALTNDADLFYLFDFGLTAGARYTLTHVFYSGNVDLDGPAGDNVTTHRVGPAILYKFFEDDPPTAFKRAYRRVARAVVVGPSLSHRQRPSRRSRRSKREPGAPLPPAVLQLKGRLLPDEAKPKRKPVEVGSISDLTDTHREKFQTALDAELRRVV